MKEAITDIMTLTYFIERLPVNKVKSSRPKVANCDQQPKDAECEEADQGTIHNGFM